MLLIDMMIIVKATRDEVSVSTQAVNVPRRIISTNWGKKVKGLWGHSHSFMVAARSPHQPIESSYFVPASRPSWKTFVIKILLNPNVTLQSSIVSSNINIIVIVIFILLCAFQLGSEALSSPCISIELVGHSGSDAAELACHPQQLLRGYIGNVACSTFRQCWACPRPGLNMPLECDCR